MILGRGSYGTVLRAIYKKLNVAVKILKKSCSTYKSLKQEANILGLKQENVIEILKIVECNTYGAVVMERFEGSKSLQYVLDNHKVDLIHRLHILSDISAGLAFCHQNKIVHLDLKPQNVLVAIDDAKRNNDRLYICKLLDFGCSIKLDIECDPYDHFAVSVSFEI